MNGTHDIKPRGCKGHQARAERKARRISKVREIELLIGETEDPLLILAVQEWAQRTASISIGRSLAFIYDGAPQPVDSMCHKAQWLSLHKDYDKPQCLLMPHARPNFPATVKYNFARMTAARAMLVMTAGQPKSDEMVARHVCGNGHLSCVNPTHLVWGTQGDNIADANKHRNQNSISEKVDAVF